jgi:hypothetical protein
VFKVESDHIEVLAKDQVGIFFDENIYIIYASAVKGSYSDQKTIVSSNSLKSFQFYYFLCCLLLS